MRRDSRRAQELRALVESGAAATGVGWLIRSPFERGRSPGVPAAVLMAMVHALVRATPQPLQAPDRVLAHLGDQLARALPEGSFVTACYVQLDPPSGQVDYAVAGHQAPMILRVGTGTVEQLPSRGGLPFGPLPALPYDAGVATMACGDVLVLSTDGVTEAMSPTRELFGEERLRDALLEARSKSVQEMCRNVIARVEDHLDGATLSDDLTLLLLRRDADKMDAPSDDDHRVHSTRATKS
jgi:sigma-B regulation protein RsbU (phosphoserine phosphatase)